jgi:alpha-tubulin suppressor-like RCC1 family protein
MLQSTCNETPLAPDCVVVRRVVQYIPHSPLTLKVTLERACLGVQCPENKTCSRGNCVDSNCEKNPALCAPSDAGVDEGGVVDASPVLAPVIALFAGGDGSCSLHADGSVRCWGDDTVGQLAFPSTGILASPTLVPNLQDFRKLALGLGFACGIGPAQDVLCWGDDAKAGRLGQAPTMMITPQPAPVTRPGTWMQSAVIAVGGRHACASAFDGLWCWGDNGSSQLGVPGTQLSGAVKVLKRQASIALGAAHSCVSDAQSTQCWGANESGQCGQPPSGTPIPSPTALASPPTASTLMLSAGKAFTCGASGKSAYCWGEDANWELGFPVIPPVSSVPLQNDLSNSGQNADVSAIGSGQHHTCASVPGFGLYCWGMCDVGQCGSIKTKPLFNVLDTMGADLLAVGARHVCVAQSQTTHVRCFGANDKGQLGTGVTGAPVDLQSATDVVWAP